MRGAGGVEGEDEDGSWIDARQNFLYYFAPLYQGMTEEQFANITGHK